VRTSCFGIYIYIYIFCAIKGVLHMFGKSFVSKHDNQISSINYLLLYFLLLICPSSLKGKIPVKTLQRSFGVLTCLWV